MKILSIFGKAILVLSLMGMTNSCKTNCWVLTQTDPLVYTDTIHWEDLHYHYTTDYGTPHCIWIEQYDFVYRDTAWAHFYSWQKTRPCNCDIEVR